MRKFHSLLMGLSAIAVSAAFAAGAPGGGTSTGAAGTGMAPASSGSANVSQEISTALQHAEMAVGGKTADEVHQHLHHVMNCLVGPNGPEFDASTEDPCKGQGNGAMNDVDSKSDQHKQLDKALTEAKDGVGKNNVKTARSEAKDVVKYLQKAQKAKP